MRRREGSRRDWPEPQESGPSESRAYAPETLLLPGTALAAEDAQIRALVTALPDSTGPLRRIGICNGIGEIYREVTLYGPVQPLYLWAGLNALGFRQRPAGEDVLSKYWLVFSRDTTEKRPPDGGRKQAPSG